MIKEVIDLKDYLDSLDLMEFSDGIHIRTGFGSMVIGCFVSDEQLQLHIHFHPESAAKEVFYRLRPYLECDYEPGEKWRGGFEKFNEIFGNRGTHEGGYGCFLSPNLNVSRNYTVKRVVRECMEKENSLALELFFQKVFVG